MTKFIFVLSFFVSGLLAQNVLISADETYGDILTDGAGNTLYFFTKDAFDASVCYGGCADAWPIFYAEDLQVGEGLNAEDFAVITRDDESLQTTYKGWPLYYFVNDNAPGQTNGEAVNNVWFVAKPDYSVMLVDNQLVGNDGVEYTSNYEPGQEVTQYFVDAYGRTLYTFIVDTYNDNNFTAEDFSNNGVWPVYEEEPTSVPSVLDAGLFGSIDVFGRTQLTYNGWPLYYFGADSMIRGNNKGVSVPSPGIWPVAVADVAIPTAIVHDENSVPRYYKLDQNFPNPFNPSTLIKYNLPVNSNVKLVIYDLTGKVIQVLVDKTQPAGEYSILFDAQGLSSGVYFYSITAGSFSQNRKMTLIR